MARYGAAASKRVEQLAEQGLAGMRVAIDADDRAPRQRAACDKCRPSTECETPIDLPLPLPTVLEPLQHPPACRKGSVDKAGKVGIMRSSQAGYSWSPIRHPAEIQCFW